MIDKLCKMVKPSRGLAIVDSVRSPPSLGSIRLGPREGVGVHE